MGAPPGGARRRDLSLLRPQGYPAGFAQKGLLLPVDDRLQRDRRAARADFIPVQLERGVWQGKLWGLPAEAWFLVTLYNPALLARAGLTAPADTWTWDAWLDAARRVAALPAPDGARTFGADDLAMWEVLVWAWGGELLNRPETECVLNRPPAPDALQWRADLLNRHGAVPAPADLTGVQNGARGLFEQGRLGTFTVGNWALVDVQTAAQMPWGVAPVPAGRAGRWTLAGGAMYGALKDGKQADAAWDLLADLVMGDAAQVMATEFEHAPVAQADDQAGAAAALQAGLAPGHPGVDRQRPAAALQPPPVPGPHPGVHDGADAGVARAEGRQGRRRRDRAGSHPPAQVGEPASGGRGRRAPAGASFFMGWKLVREWTRSLRPGGAAAPPGCASGRTGK